jgi:hypothetical protein
MDLSKPQDCCREPVRLPRAGHRDNKIRTRHILAADRKECGDVRAEQRFRRPLVKGQLTPELLAADAEYIYDIFWRSWWWLLLGWRGKFWRHFPRHCRCQPPRVRQRYCRPRWIASGRVRERAACCAMEAVKSNELHGYRCIAHDRRDHLGDDNQIVPIRASAMLSSKLIKNARLETYKGAPHGLCSTLKDKVNADLLSFLSLRRGYGEENYEHRQERHRGSLYRPSVMRS